MLELKKRSLLLLQPEISYKNCRRIYCPWGNDYGVKSGSNKNLDSHYIALEKNLRAFDRNGYHMK
jgi:hypothetical protein